MFHVAHISSMLHKYLASSVFSIIHLLTIVAFSKILAYPQSAATTVHKVFQQSAKQATHGESHYKDFLTTAWCGMWTP